MSSKKFRKLDIDLPHQRLFDQRPWLAAGLLLAFIILLMSAYAYFNNIKRGTLPKHTKEIYRSRS
jgi:heme/copper-type cytochrome/quinol oxidase subunit 3